MKQPWFVLGGGIIGLLCARELRAANESVVIYDRQAVGQESSWAGGGILSPLYPWRYSPLMSRLVRFGQQRYPELATELRVATGVDPEWVRSGMLFFDVADQQVAQDWARQQGGVEAEWLAPSAARQVESAVAADLGPALWMPGVAQIRNPRLLAALTAELRQSGVEFRQNCTVRGFLSKGGSLTGIRTSAGDIATTRCVVAAGAWSAQLLAQTGLALPVRPVKGQMLLFYAPSLELKRILIKDGHYVIPRLDGHILTGSTLEETGFDKSTTPGAFEELREAAIHLAPGLAAAPVVRHWAGLRPGSPEGIPFIGPHPAIAGLYVCTGHFRYGIVLGPASARLLVDCALDREPLIDLGQFLPPTA